MGDLQAKSLLWGAFQVPARTGRQRMHERDEDISRGVRAVSPVAASQLSHSALEKVCFLFPLSRPLKINGLKKNSRNHTAKEGVQEPKGDCKGEHTGGSKGGQEVRGVKAGSAAKEPD